MKLVSVCFIGISEFHNSTGSETEPMESAGNVLAVLVIITFMNFVSKPKRGHWDTMIAFQGLCVAAVSGTESPESPPTLPRIPQAPAAFR